MNEVDYNRLLEIANKDENLIGLILGGSRGKGVQTKYSDYDVYIIVKDTSSIKYSKFGVQPITIEELEHSTPVWDKYNFTHLVPVIDNTKGRLQVVIDELARLSDKQQNEIVLENLDMYINFVYRSFKSHRDKNIFASHLDAAESVSPMLYVIFALEGRVRPYNKYLQWELNKFPLTKLGMSSGTLLSLIENIIVTGSIKSQHEIYSRIEKEAESEGYQKIYTAWGEDLEIIKHSS